jgi:hypothetical protein
MVNGLKADHCSNISAYLYKSTNFPSEVLEALIFSIKNWQK